MGVEVVGETPSLRGEFVGETHRVLECIQIPPHGNQNQKGPIYLWVVVEVTKSWQRAEQVPLFSLGLLHHRQHDNAARGLPNPGEYLRFGPLLHNRCARKKNVAQ